MTSDQPSRSPAPTTALSATAKLLVMGAVVLGCSLVLVLFVMRLISAVTVGDVQQASGLEGAGIFGVLQTCRGIDVYSGLPQDPNGYIFNFLFYRVYGVVTGGLSSCGGDAMIIARVMSALAMGLTSVLIAFTARREGCGWPAAAFLAAAPLGPYVGWWAFAIRPDPIAFLATVAALAAARWAITSEKRIAVALTFAAAFVAWGFKQPYLILLPALALYIGASVKSWRFRGFVVAVAALVGAGIAAILLADPNMRLHTMTFPANRAWVNATEITNLTGFFVKAAPFLIIAALVTVLTAPARFRAMITPAWGDTPTRAAVLLAGMGLGLFLVFAFLAGHVGAADNYFFPVLAVAVAITAQGLPAIAPRWQAIALIGSALILALLTAPVMLGVRGARVLSDSNRADRIAFSKALASAPGPVLVIDDTFGMPTYSPNAKVRLFDPYVYHQGPEKVMGAGSSLQARISHGEFALIGVQRGSEFDFSSYDRTGEIGNMIICRRHGDPV